MVFRHFQPHQGQLVKDTNFPPEYWLPRVALQLGMQQQQCDQIELQDEHTPSLKKID